MKGYIPLTLSDGSIHWQLCYYSANAVETIISPQAILASSDIFSSWTMTGYKTDKPGAIRFDSHDGFATITIPLVCREGLYYCPTDVFTLGNGPTMVAHAAGSSPPSVLRVTEPSPTTVHRRPPRTVPTTKARQLESEVWLLRLGSPGVSQLDVLPQNVTGIPATFEYHPFRFVDFKEQAKVCKQAAQRSAIRTTDRRRRFYMDYGFMRASTSDYRQRDKSKDRVVLSYDGYSSYLLIVDEASRFVWVFLTNSKSPPIDILQEFLRQHGHEEGGCIRTDQGGELARSAAFQDTLLCDFHYTLEPTGADSPSQNGAVEIYNDKFAVRTRTLLYGSGLPAKFWSAALLHSVYLHNRLIHSETRITPLEGYFGVKPDLSHLKVFGSRVCVKRSGDRGGKLDRNDFSGIFLGFTATDHNIRYLDLTTGIVKQSHHAQFDEAWYMQPERPPAAQLLYDLGLEVDILEPDSDGPDLPAPWPPLTLHDKKLNYFVSPLSSLITPLPLRETCAYSRPFTAAAALTKANDGSDLSPCSVHRVSRSNPSDIVTEFLIGKQDMATVYMSPDPYYEAFEEVLNLRKFDPRQHRAAGLSLISSDNRLVLAGMTPGTPGANIPRWRSRLKGAWLIKVGSTLVTTLADVQAALDDIYSSGAHHVTLLFSHPEVR